MWTARALRGTAEVNGKSKHVVSAAAQDVVVRSLVSSSDLCPMGELPHALR